MQLPQHFTNLSLELVQYDILFLYPMSILQSAMFKDIKFAFNGVCIKCFTRILKCFYVPEDDHEIRVHGNGV